MDLEAELVERVVPQLERLEKTFRPLAEALPITVEPDFRFVAAEEGRMNIQEAGRALRAREVSSVELTEAAIQKIEELNPKLNAFLTVTAELARAQALQADEELGDGVDRGALHGIPVALKDVFCTKGIRTTLGSRPLADFVPEYDATVAVKLREAGSVLLGKTGMHEFAYGITSTNPHYGRCGTRRTRSVSRAGRAGDRGRRWRRGWCLRRWGATRAGRFGCRRRSAGRWG